MMKLFLVENALKIQEIVIHVLAEKKVLSVMIIVEKDAI
jgi:hypothetical protein